MSTTIRGFPPSRANRSGEKKALRENRPARFHRSGRQSRFFQGKAVPPRLYRPKPEASRKEKGQPISRVSSGNVFHGQGAVAGSKPRHRRIFPLPTAAATLLDLEPQPLAHFPRLDGSKRQSPHARLQGVFNQNDATGAPLEKRC
jgi:hypothetical protein